MLDWWLLVRGVLWIMGLALMVAVWSYARWWAGQRGLSLRRAVGLPLFAVPCCAGLALFSLGLALSARTWWETAAWAILAVLSLTQAAYSAHARRLQRFRRDQPHHVNEQ